MQSHKYSIDGNNCFSQPAGYSLAITAQDALGLGTLLITCCSPAPPNPFLPSCFLSTWPPAHKVDCYSVPDAGCCTSICWTSWDSCQPISLACWGPFSALTTPSQFAVICTSSHHWGLWQRCYTVSASISTLEAYWPPAGPAAADHSPWAQRSSQFAAQLIFYLPISYLPDVVKGGLWVIVSKALLKSR